MLDLHNHLLPGIDDGAEDFAETLRMARMAWGDGIRTIVATPHLWWSFRENWFGSVQKLAGRVEVFLKENGVPLRIIPGTEVPTREGSLDLLREGRLPLLGESRCVLLEPPFAGLPPDMPRFVDQFLKQGFRILLAHPERCRSLQERPELVDTFLPPEMPLQLTSHSITGDFGERPRAAAQAFLSGNRPMIIATDAHSATRRPPLLTSAVRAASALVGQEYARQMVTDLPLALLEDRPIWPPKPQF